MVLKATLAMMMLMTMNLEVGFVRGSFKEWANHYALKMPRMVMETNPTMKGIHHHYSGHVDGDGCSRLYTYSDDDTAEEIHAFDDIRHLSEPTVFENMLSLISGMDLECEFRSLSIRISSPEFEQQQVCHVISKCMKWSHKHKASETVMDPSKSMDMDESGVGMVEEMVFYSPELRLEKSPSDATPIFVPVSQHAEMRVRVQPHDLSHTDSEVSFSITECCVAGIDAMSHVIGTSARRLHRLWNETYLDEFDLDLTSPSPSPSPSQWLHIQANNSLVMLADHCFSVPRFLLEGEPPYI